MQFTFSAGEVIPDVGDAKVCGLSIGSQTASARQNLGYCPQFSALPGALTGREVLWMYARLRGVVPALIPSTVDSLLSRLDLTQFADRYITRNAQCSHVLHTLLSSHVWQEYFGE